VIGLDTNVMVRLLFADDPLQTPQAKWAIEQAQARGEPVMLGLAVVLELVWVLGSSAKMTKAQILVVLERLLETGDIQIENEQVLEHAVQLYEGSAADFGECLFLAQYQRAGCRYMLTFDQKAARMDGAQLLVVGV
jgi:predicted nucleic-acid-binding protein